jgi:hypothetical protein
LKLGAVIDKRAEEFPADLIEVIRKDQMTVNGETDDRDTGTGSFANAGRGGAARARSNASKCARTDAGAG